MPPKLPQIFTVIVPKLKEIYPTSLDCAFLYWEGDLQYMFAVIYGTLSILELLTFFSSIQTFFLCDCLSPPFVRWCVKLSTEYL